MDSNDALLLQRYCKNGDPEAFSQIVQLYAGIVYGACRRIVRDSDLAKDIAQDTFFQLLRNASDVSGSLAGWLHSVATRKAIDVVRRDSARKVRESEYSSGKLQEAESWDEVSPYVDEALGQIDEALRQVLVKHFLEGLTMRETAERMGCSHATVSRKVDAGLDSLRAILKKRGVIVAAISLGVLMTQNAAQAAPAALMAELGKMSLAAGSGAAVGTAGGVMTAVKAKVVTAVAVVTIGTGAVVTYNNVTEEPAEETGVTETTAVADDGASYGERQTIVPSDNHTQQWQTFWEEIEAEEKPVKQKPEPAIAEEDEEVEPEPEPQAEEAQAPRTARSRRSAPGGMGGTRSARVRRTKEPNEEEETPQYGGGMGGGMMGSRRVPSSSE